MKATNSKEQGLSVNAMQAEINRLQAKISSFTEEKVSNNTAVLLEEVMNFLDGVGKGFTEGDYYASNRYYSNIPGVKNLRFGRDNDIIVKATSPIGELLPDTIEVRCVTYNIVFIESKYYSETVNY